MGAIAKRPVITPSSVGKRQGEIKKVINVKKIARNVRRPNRSIGGDIFIGFILIIFGIFFAFPLVFTINHAFKPMTELFLWPPRLWVINPTTANFQDLFILMARSWVTFSRYIFNTLFITVLGTGGHLFIASLGAYAISRYEFPGSKLFFKVVIVSLMFSGHVTAIPNFLVLANLRMIDSYWAILVPAFAGSLGFFLLKQFIDTVPVTLSEAAKIDGAGEWRIYSQIIMPLVKPAILTATIFSVQFLWNTQAGHLIHTEQLRPLPFALQQIVAGGIARAGVGAAVSLVMMVVPLTLFIVAQSRILQTMASSGIKE
ncbi:MAG: carbohydrate ABC transporter permease [Defluviitaleaceae bacterium]|nr:carbohydrate ABC transporter permease [Defluviitaleaceae bacterium]MCL2238729.1 carbohydrate ABC transporter permease [Defluviitaleaceae bacterium]